MHTFTHHSARATARPIDTSGVVEVVFSGLVNSQALRALWLCLQSVVVCAKALVVRYDRAVLTVLGDVSAYGPAGAVIASAEQHAAALENGRHCARRGVIRAVFRCEQSALAYEWAQRHARTARAESPA